MEKVVDLAAAPPARPQEMASEVINKALVIYGEVLKMAIEGDYVVRLINLVGDGRDYYLSVAVTP